MSLIDSAYENCIMMDKTTVPDNRGGFVPAYVDGAPFDAAITLDTSTAARVADAQGVKNLYTVVTPRNINLQFHDVFKRVRDNKIFRVTSDGDDKSTPQSASLDMRVVSAEEYKLGAQLNG